MVTHKPGIQKKRLMGTTFRGRFKIGCSGGGYLGEATLVEKCIDQEFEGDDDTVMDLPRVVPT